MKIIFLLQDTGTIYGAERATIDLVRGLAAAGVPVHVLLIVETRLALSRSALQDAFAAADLPFSAVTTARRLSLKLVADLHELLRAQRATVLHSTGYKADLHGFLAARRAGIPQVSTVHGWLFRPDPKERFYAWLNVQVFRRCARVIALSRFYEQLLRARRVAGVVRIPTGFACEGSVSGPAKSGGACTFGILGRLSSEKNHALFLEAAAALHRRGVAAGYLIGGDGPERAAIQERIRALGLRGAVELAGYVPTGAFFRRIDALVLCSRMENLPLVVMEAMARGIPVIATHVGGLPDLVEEGATGRLVPPGDPARLADAMAGFAEDPALAARLGAAGRAKLEREYSFELWIRRHRELYGALCSPL